MVDNSMEARRRRLNEMHTPGAARVEPGRDLSHIDVYDPHPPIKPMTPAPMGRPEREWRPTAIPRVSPMPAAVAGVFSDHTPARTWLDARQAEWAAFHERAAAWEATHSVGVA